MSMNRDKHCTSFIPQEEVEHRKLYSEPLSESTPANDKPRDRRMIRRFWVGIGVLAVIIVALIGVLIFCLIPTPEDVQLRMYAVQISGNGTVLNEGQFVLSGERMHYPGKLKRDVLAAEEVSILNFNFYPDRAELHFTDLSEDGHTLLSGFAVDEDFNAQHSLMLEISADEQWCVIEWGSKFLVCSTNENFDPNEILAQSLLKPE